MARESWGNMWEKWWENVRNVLGRMWENVWESVGRMWKHVRKMFRKLRWMENSGIKRSQLGKLFGKCLGILAGKNEGEEMGRKWWEHVFLLRTLAENFWWFEMVDPPKLYANTTLGGNLWESSKLYYQRVFTWKACPSASNPSQCPPSFWYLKSCSSFICHAFLKLHRSSILLQFQPTFHIVNYSILVHWGVNDRKSPDLGTCVSPFFIGPDIVPLGKIICKIHRFAERDGRLRWWKPWVSCGKTSPQPVHWQTSNQISPFLMVHPQFSLVKRLPPPKKKTYFHHVEVSWNGNTP